LTTAAAGRDLLVYHGRNFREIVGQPLYDPNRHTQVQPVTWSCGRFACLRSQPCWRRRRSCLTASREPLPHILYKFAQGSSRPVRQDSVALFAIEDSEIVFVYDACLGCSCVSEFIDRAGHAIRAVATHPFIAIRPL
jgi:hypothetical protein